MHKHHISIRTNPKGTNYLGRCLMCGEENLDIKSTKSPCSGGLLSYDEAMKIAFKNPHGDNKITIVRKLDA